MSNTPGNETFTNITNNDIYDKVITMERQLHEWRVYINVILFVVMPVITVIISTVTTNIMKGM